MPSSPVRPSPPMVGDFDPNRFKRKTGFRDYLIYGVVAVFLLGLIGGGIYYFTRSKPEQAKLHAKLDHAVGAGDLPDGRAVAELKEQTRLAGILGDDEAAKVAADKQPKQAKPAGVSTYAGGGANRVILSADPKLPAAGPEFIGFVGALKVSSVLQGTQAKAVINGRLFRAGEIIDPAQGVLFMGIDAAGPSILFRDKTGAELGLTY